MPYRQCPRLHGRWPRRLETFPHSPLKSCFGHTCH
jgi:hypothetical protein